MTTPIYNKKLGVRAHRLLWWLLANQEKDANDIPTGFVSDGWRSRAARELKLTPACMWGATTALKNAGVITFKPYQKSVKINGSALEI